MESMTDKYPFLLDITICTCLGLFSQTAKSTANASTMKCQYSPSAYENRKPRIANNVFNGMSFLGSCLGQKITCNVVECEQHMVFLVHVSRQSNLHLHRHCRWAATVCAAELPLVTAQHQHVRVGLLSLLSAGTDAKASTHKKLHGQFRIRRYSRTCFRSDHFQAYCRQLKRL